jgi:hypothetical protein
MARRCAVTAAVVLCVLAAAGVSSVAARSTRDQNEPVPAAVRCAIDAQTIASAEQQFFVAHDRFGAMQDLSFEGVRKPPARFTVALWPGNHVYVLTPVKGKGCELPSDPSLRFAAKAASFCGGVQQAVYGLQSSVLRGRDLPPEIPPEASAEFYRRGASLISPLRQHLATLSPPARLKSQWQAALRAFDGLSALLDDLARTRPTDFATDRAVFERHRDEYQRFVDAWAPLVDDLGINLQACQYIGFSPSSGR